MHRGIYIYVHVPDVNLIILRNSNMGPRFRELNKNTARLVLGVNKLCLLFNSFSNPIQAQNSKVTG